MNRKKSYLTILSGLLACGMAVTSQAQEGDKGIASMVTDGKASLDVRYRYEYVDQDGFDRNAKASTVRTRLTLASAEYEGFSFLTEFDNVAHINDDFNSTDNGKTNYPVVADPKGTDFNQVWAKYSWDELSGTYGRQRILHGSQRFVGGVGWRQNEQTYDGFRAQWGGVEGLKLDYAYVYNVNRIFGPDDGGNPADLHGENHLLRADWKFLENHTLTGFYYGLDFDMARGYETAPGKSVGNSSDTYGLEYAGKLGPVGLKGAWATQSDAGDNPASYDADYYMLEGAMDIVGINFKLGYELLGGDDEGGFKTPLATLHKFQGWADKFLGTPNEGIEDIYLGATGKLGPVKLGAFYHDFGTDESHPEYGSDYGTEWDLVATWPINKQFTTQLKYANFSSDTDNAKFQDTEKVWFTLQMKL